MISNRIGIFLSALIVCTSCAAIKGTPAPTFREVLQREDKLQDCYITESGMAVGGEDGLCENEKVVEQAEQDIVSLRALDKDYFATTLIFFTNTRIHCNGEDVGGCTDGNVIIIYNSKNPHTTRRLLRHELGHVYLWIESGHKDADAAHNKQLFWALVDKTAPRNWGEEHVWSY